LIKGTRFILKAVRKLQKEGLKFDFILVEKKSHNEAMEIFKEADIIVDEVLQGPYGILAIEAMSFGKPVLCRIDPAFEKCYKNLPIVNTPKDQIYPNLKRLIEHPLLRKKLGEEGRRYVEKNHDSLKIAQKLIKLYQEI
jgi:glycosyltransferase involved in cell wall biosynthesis